MADSAMGLSFSVEGYVAPGYEPVKKMFADNFYNGKESSAQLCVYVGEEKVVDLWASINDPDYDGDTLTNVFSSTKSLAAIALATLVDKGILKYTDRISQHWPEFGQNGKEDITVADLMRHEAGLAAFDTTLMPEDFSREGIKANKVGAVIERQPSEFPDTGKRQYHAITRGWIINELFRRLEPSGATLGEFLEAEVAQPFQAGVHIGGKPSARYCPVQPMAATYAVTQSFIPQAIGRAVDPNFLDLLKMVAMFRNLGSSGKPKAFDKLDRAGRVWNSPEIREGELPSANGNCSARGLAKVAAVMANGGSFEGKTLLSPSGWAALHDDPVSANLFPGLKLSFTQGGVCPFEDKEGKGRTGYTGWMGFGGSVFQWHNDLKIGFGYVPTYLNWIDLINNKARKLQEEVVRCAAANLPTSS